MKVCVVVLNWNAYEETIVCLENILKFNIRFTLVLVDNGSTDNSIEKLKPFENRVKFIKNTSNLGFAGGVNKGIRWCIKNNFEFVALINNDAIPEYNWLNLNVSFMQQDASVGIVTGLMLDSQGKYIDSASEEYSNWGLPFPRDRNKKKEDAPVASYVFGATGGGSLYRTSMLKEIGLFDEDFFAYYEDVDLSFRAQLAGWKVYYNPLAITYHKRGLTSNKIPGFTTYQTFKNLPLLYVKNVPVSMLFSIGIRFKLAYLIMLSKAIFKGKGKYAVKGLLMSCILVVKKIPSRIKIQSNKKVSSYYIRSILWRDLPPNQSGLRKLRKLFINR